MALLIDGYNLLNAVGIVGRDVALGSLQRSRLALLNFLAESLRPDEIPRTTVVFDARNPPPGLPRVVDHRGMTVRFAARHQDADSLIEELIRSDPAPRRLTVVSSDHRLHRAARRRKARAVDSDVWYAEIVRQRQQRQEATFDVPARPPVPLLEEHVDYWIDQFGGESLLAKWIEKELEDLADNADDPYNPFPPGYAADVEE